MDIGEIIEHAAKINWKFKGLWVLGILGSCRGGMSQLTSSFTSNFRGVEISESDLWRFERFLENFDWENFSWENINLEMILMGVIGILAVLLLLWLISFIIEILGAAGLIAGFKQADSGETISLGIAFNLGLSYFWRLVGIQLIVLAITLSAVLIIGIVTLAISIPTLGFGALCLLPLFFLLIPLFIAAGVYVNLSQIALITEDLTIRAAFARSWKIIKENIGNVILVALILLVGPWIVGAIISIPFGFAGLPTLLGLSFFEGDFLIQGLAGTMLCAVAYFPLYLLFSGILNTFTTGTWTLAYRRLIGQKGLSLRSKNDAGMTG
jgi:hypothetical protein